MTTATAADAIFQQATPKKDDEAPPTFQRDRWGRPLIKPIGAGNTIPYIRVSTLAGALDDKTALGDWKARMTGVGVARSSDLQVAFGSLQELESKESKQTANELAEQAQERAKSSAKRIMGTGFHSITEAHDRGTPPEFVPEQLRPLYEDYARLTADVKWLAIEQFVVVDEVRAAGTTDRVGIRPNWKLPRVFDVKTGRVDYGALKFAVQMACYARGVFYNPATGERRPWPSIDLEVGIILHADPETGKVTPHEVDLVEGWRAAKVALEAYDLRRNRKIMQKSEWGSAPAPLTNVEQVKQLPLAEAGGAAVKAHYESKVEMVVEASIMKRLAACRTVEDIKAVYAETGTQWEHKHRTFADYMASDIRKGA